MTKLSTYKKLFDALESGKFGSIYLLHGDEDYVLEEFLVRLRDVVLPPDTRAFNDHRLSAESLEAASLASLLRAYPLMHTHSLVVIRGCESLDKASESALDRYLDEPSESTVLVLVYGALDRRRRLAKRLEKIGKRIEFKPLDGSERGRWLKSRLKRSKLDLDAGTAAYLVESVPGGLQGLEHEIEKLSLAYPEGGSLDRKEVASVLGEHHLEESVWELTECLRPDGEIDGVRLLTSILDRGEAPQKILGALNMQVLRLLKMRYLVEEGETEGAMKKQAGIHPYYFGKTLNLARSAEVSWFRNWLDNLAWADLEMKTTQVPTSILLEVALIAGFRGRAVSRG